MGTHFISVTIAIMALASTLASASDSSPLQDFCVAVNDSKTASLQGPKARQSQGLLFFSLFTPRKTSNPVGSTVTPVNVIQIPGVNTLGLSLALVDFAPYGLNPPHTHPRATEILVVLEGSLYVGFVGSNPEKIACSPKSFIQGKTNAVASSGLSSQNPGVITVANAVLGSNPKISDDVLAKAFQVDKKVVDNLQAQFWWPNN
ncbi:hypothetical protein HYC85_001871 [Camellia sinensis]|uniref:Cupin type-1 domain-containing protein n=1 Tax=Camellia sinensis TaxID=4442 RepID=A0A7J7I6K5_CAMSI|nr:hypothetical protein HYC85_001871 [Camellia sinensis]